MLVIHATTAALPGLFHDRAVSALLAGVEQREFGVLDCSQIQLCPQAAGILDETVIDRIRGAAPDAALRLHATVPVMQERFVRDRAWLNAGSRHYWQRVAELSRYAQAPVFSFHAGTREGHTLEDTLAMARGLEEMFEAPVAIEGLYPERGQSWLMSSWAEYRWVMEREVPYALDLSHLNIVAAHERHIDAGLLRELLTHPCCTEIHVSDNDGANDRHWLPNPGRTPFWMPLLRELSATQRLAPIFSESWHDWPKSRAADRHPSPIDAPEPA